MDKQAKVVAEITLTGTSATQDLDDIGITVTEGSGSPSLTTGDTAVAFIRPVNYGNSEIIFGTEAARRKEFGLIMVSPVQSTGVFTWMDILKCKATNSINLAITENEFSEWTLEGTAMYDICEDRIFHKYIFDPRSCPAS